MFRFLGLLITSVGILSALSVWGYLSAQEKGEKGVEPKLVRPTEIRFAQPVNDADARLWTAPKVKAQKPDADLEAWLKTLAPKITDRHDKIRESARQAIVWTGPYAIDLLTELSKSTDNATAIAAKGLLERIQQPVLGYAPWASSPVYSVSPGREAGKEDKKEEKTIREPGRGEFKKSDKKGTGGPLGPEARQRLFRELDLSGDLKAKVEDALDTQQQAMRGFFEKSRAEGADQNKIMGEMREIREAFHKTIRELLGPDKFQKFMELTTRTGAIEKKAKDFKKNERPKD